MPYNTADLTSCYSYKFAWELWHRQLIEKSKDYLDPQNNLFLWLNQAGLSRERTLFLMNIHERMLGEEHELVKQCIVKALEDKQGDSDVLYTEWMVEAARSRSACLALEEHVYYSTPKIARVAGDLAQFVRIQPGYEVNAQFFSMLAQRVAKSPKNPLVALDKQYMQLFTQLAGCVGLAVELGIYYHFDILSFSTRQLIQACLAHDKLVVPILNTVKSVYPDMNEISIMSHVKKYTGTLSVLCFFLSRCWADSFTSVALWKWGALMMVMLGTEHLSKQFSTAISNTIFDKKRQNAFFSAYIMQQTIAIIACIYLYPWIVQSMEYFTASDLRQQALDILELGADASLTDINKQYRKLARQYHPDLNKAPGAKEKMSQIHDAFAYLRQVVVEVTKKETNTYSVPR